MRNPTMFLLCLIAALSGTPLRQAEAANDFARSVAEFGPGDLIETIDGGVGDDQEASILKASGDSYPFAAAIPAAMTVVHFAPPIAASSFTAAGDIRRTDQCRSLSASSGRRFAWLQCFLF